MLLAHRIQLIPDHFCQDYFLRAAGTARRVWNWALAEWIRQQAAGLRPNAMALKKQFNRIKYGHPDWCDESGRPWLKDIHRDAHAQPFHYLGRAWSQYFAQCAHGRVVRPPTFKKKGKCPLSFYVANDKFRIEGKTVLLPKVGRVGMRESLRFDGKIMGATICHDAGRWFISVNVDVSQSIVQRRRTGNNVVGVDLGVSVAATLSTGECIVSPRPLLAASRRLRIRSRRLSRKCVAAKGDAAGAGNCLGDRFVLGSNRQRATLILARLHARIRAVRSDFTHKLTTRLCRENQTIVIEDLHVKGMLANHSLARAISDTCFGRIRDQLRYKALRFGVTVVLADRWYPSSKLCSHCGNINGSLELSCRAWNCPACGARLHRDHNAAINLMRLATAAEEAFGSTALPVASVPATASAIATKLL